MKRLLLSRHAESLYNVEGLINADPERQVSPLTERGVEQARALGRTLPDEQLDLCVTSETLRAVSTSEIALSGRSLPRVRLSLLNDPPAGRFEDGPNSEFAQWMDSNGMYAIVPGTDTTIAASASRFLGAAEFLLARPEDTVLVIAHAPVLRWLQQAATKATGRLDYTQPLFEYAELFELAVEDLREGARNARADPSRVFASS